MTKATTKAITVLGCTSRSAGHTRWTVSTWTSRPARCTASSVRTAPGSPPRSGSCWACCAATGAAQVLATSAARWTAPPGSPRSGDVTLWRNLSGGEVIDLYGRLRRGGSTGAPGGTDRALRTQPHQEGTRLLQGQPAEGRPRRRLRLGRRPADPRRAHVGSRPADGGGLPADRRGGTATAAGPSCSPPHPRARWSCATASASSARAAPVKQHLADLRHLTRTGVSAELAGTAQRAGPPARRARPGHPGPPGSGFQVDRPARRRTALARRLGRTVADLDAADPGGTVPAALQDDVQDDVRVNGEGTMAR